MLRHLARTLKGRLFRPDPFISPKTLSRKSIEERFGLLVRIAGEVMPEYRLGWYQIHWWQDREFESFLARFGEPRSLNAHRRWAVKQLLRLVVSLPGDTAECGVFQGAGSWLIGDANRRANEARIHHCFDSFEGLSEPGKYDSPHWLKGALACSLNEVSANLVEFGDSIRFYPGWIPTRFPEVADRTFCFVHVDVDLYEPTRESLTFFYPRLVKGAVLVCDDYGFTTCPGATKACDDFLAETSEKMLPLPDGGGFFIKGLETAPPTLP